MPHLELIDVFVGDKAPAACGRAVHHDNSVRRHTSVKNNSMVTWLCRAGEKTSDKARIGLVDFCFDKLDRLPKSVVVAPNVDRAHRGSTKLDLFVCQTGPNSRRDDNCSQRNLRHDFLPARGTYLGTFDGERKLRSAGYDEEYSLTKTVAAFTAMACTLFATALMLGAL